MVFVIKQRKIQEFYEKNEIKSEADGVTQALS